MNTFVCLQAEVNINTPEHAWRSQHGLRPYIKDAQKILSKAHETGNPKITQQKIDFLHLPIIDGNVTTDSAMNRLAEDCMERVLRGEKLYIHCWGGHGRTGTLVAVMLGRLYNLPYTTALRYTQAFHDARVYPQGVRSPQTPVQRAQVRRLLAGQGATSAPPLHGNVRPAAGLPGRSASSVLTKPGSSILSSDMRPVVSPVSSMRSAQAPPSPLRSRIGGSGNVGGRYGLGRSESPMKAGYDRDYLRASAADRLANDFSKLSGPSVGRAGSNMPSYMLAQR